MVVTEKSHYLDYAVFTLNDHSRYYVKENKVYTSYAGWNAGKPGLNLSFYAAPQDTTVAFTESDCYPATKFTTIKRIKEVVIEGKLYKNCFEFSDPDHTAYQIVAYGVGIIEKSFAGKKIVLIDHTLH